MTSSNHKTKRGVIKADKTVELTSFEGIMPDPETLEKLERFAPGCTREWMDMAKSEIAHRQKMEDRITWTFKNTSIFSIFFGFVANLAVCFVGYIAITLNHPTAGATIITGSAAAVITAFLFKRRNQQ
jgi:uncharacterized membrane protein